MKGKNINNDTKNCEETMVRFLLDKERMREKVHTNVLFKFIREFERD